MLAWRYENLGLTEDADYWVAVGLAHTPQPEQKFYYKAMQFQIRGDLAGLRTEIDKLRIALGPDIDALHGIYAAEYAVRQYFGGKF